MQEIGNTLRQLRLQKGLTLEQVEQSIKIRLRYLQAIEEGDMSVLPGMVYARGFIKSYAEFLGINGQDLLDSHEGTSQVETSQSSSMETLTRSERSKPDVARASVLNTRLLPQILGGAGVLAVVVVAYMFLLSNTEDQQTQEPVQAEQNQTAAPATEPAKQPAAPAQQQPEPTPPPKPATVIEPLQKAANQSSFAVKSTEAMTLVMAAATGDCWVQVVADGKVVASETVKKGEKRTWKADKTLSLQTGNSKVITMQINEQNVVFEPQLRGYTYSFERKS